MYIPQHFQQLSQQKLRSLIHDHPLATLVTNTQDGLCANHIPLIIDDNQAEDLRLHGHIARANPLNQAEILGDTLAIFQGPNAYISPNWYATKQQHGKVVPTWNYVAVHATGNLRIIDDRDWTMRMISRLTDKEEATQPAPWAVSDAPASFTEGLLSSVVGIELVVTSLEGKWKVSQNQPEQNREGVQDGLDALSNPHAATLSGHTS